MSYIVVIDIKNKTFKTTTGWTADKAEAKLFDEAEGYVLINELRQCGERVTFEKYYSKKVFAEEIKFLSKKGGFEVEVDLDENEYTAGVGSSINDY